MSAPFQQPIDASTRFCAVLGHPIKHSASPAMQNAGIAALGLESELRYLAFDVHPDHLRAAIKGAQTMGFVGLNLTVPHKLRAYKLKMFDTIPDENVRLYKAINTLKFGLDERTGEPVIEGYNTDADAVSQSLKEDLNLKIRGSKVVILGAGGAGRTAALKIASEGAKKIFLINRSKRKPIYVAKDIKVNFQVETQIGYPKPGECVDLILNATSLGLKPDDALPFDEKQFSIQQARTAYDMIYRPAETPFLKAAKAAGCQTANGLGMLLYQGAKALEIWTGKTAPIAVMRAALEQNVYGAK